MTATPSDPRNDRILVRFEVYYSFERVEGTAALSNISYTGAMIEDTAMRPEIGTRIILYVYLDPPDSVEAAAPFELAGEVVRHSSTGFAIKYEDKFDPDVRRMIDDVVAVSAIRG